MSQVSPSLSFLSVLGAARNTATRLAAALATFTVLLALTASPAGADIEIEAPASSTVGQSVLVVVTVTENGQPVPDVEVSLSRQAELGGVFGFPELASAVTDANGVAVFDFVQRAETGGSDSLYRAAYEGPDGPVEEDFEMVVHPGPQQYVTTAGVDSGLASVWWLYIVLAIIWGSLVFAVYQLVMVARAATGPRAFASAPYLMVAFVAFTGVGMFLVVGTRPDTHAVLAPTESFDRDPAALVGVDYEYAGHGDHTDMTFHGSPADGETIYIKSGCAGCHGLADAGLGVVGGHLSQLQLADSQIFRDLVRLGPGGMPTYGEGVVSDAEIERIREWALAEIEGRPPQAAGGLSAVVGGPYVGESQQGIIFDGRASGTGGRSIVAYRWDFGDGGPIVDFGTASAVVQHSFLNDGIYEVTLTVVDERGASASATTSALIGDSHPPITNESNEGESDTTDTTTDQETTSTEEAGQSPTGDSERGEEIYRAMCASCHGPGNPIGGDLAQSTATPDALMATIINGEGAMPAFGGQLSDEEIAHVVEYLNMLLEG